MARDLVRVGLYGTNGHQLRLKLGDAVRARVVAVAGCSADWLQGQEAQGQAPGEGLRVYDNLEELLTDGGVDLVSLCSPVRAQQPKDALLCMEAGKHVLAEKPGALTFDELDRILEAEVATGMQFREMNDSMMEAPVRAMRRLVDSGKLGTVVHAQVQKSYPWLDTRPQDHDRDGGLTRQAGIHGARFLVASTGLKLTSVRGIATRLGNPLGDGIQIAAGYTLTFANGAIASMNFNYLNPPNFGTWGNENLRIHGTRGMVESVDGFRRHSLYIGASERSDLDLGEPGFVPDYLHHYANYLLDGTPFPTSREEELNALRAVIAAHESARAGGPVRIPV